MKKQIGLKQPTLPNPVHQHTWEQVTLVDFSTDENIIVNQCSDCFIYEDEADLDLNGWESGLNKYPSMLGMDNPKDV